MNALEKREKKSYAIKKLYLYSVSLTGAIGTIDEIYQHFLPRRYCTIYDIFLNILGGILGLLVFWGTRRQ
jgi:VanZ family protein